jgi:hypothetical protein
MAKGDSSQLRERGSCRRNLYYWNHHFPFPFTASEATSTSDRGTSSSYSYPSSSPATLLWHLPSKVVLLLHAIHNSNILEDPQPSAWLAWITHTDPPPLHCGRHLRFPSFQSSISGSLSSAKFPTNPYRPRLSNHLAPSRKSRWHNLSSASLIRIAPQARVHVIKAEEVEV